MSLSEFIFSIDKMIQGIKERGKADYKTILDALIPAEKSLNTSLENQDDILTTFKNAYTASKEGMINTINMQSRKGRAARYLENSKGKQDPGATVGMLIFNGFLTYIENQSNLTLQLNKQNIE